MERIDRGVAPRGERDPVGGRHHQQPAGPQHPGALTDELWLIPQVLDDLEVDHNVDRLVGQRQLGQVAVDDLHPRVTGPHVRDGGLVVIQRDHPARDPGDQVGAIAFPAARLQHLTTRTVPRQLLVDHLMAAKPVILHVEARDGAFTGQRQNGILGGVGNVGDECAHCIGRLTPGDGFANASLRVIPRAGWGSSRSANPRGDRTCRTTRYGVRANRTKLPVSNMRVRGAQDVT